MTPATTGTILYCTVLYECVYCTSLSIMLYYILYCCCCLISCLCWLYCRIVLFHRMNINGFQCAEAMKMDICKDINDRKTRIAATITAGFQANAAGPAECSYKPGVDYKGGTIHPLLCTT